MTMLKYVDVKPGSHLNMREKPSTSSKVIQKLERTAVVHVVDEYENGWSKISVSGLIGYVATAFLKPLFTTTTKPCLNMRDKVTEARVAQLHPSIRDKVKECILKAESGLPSWIAVRVVQGLRTIEEQNGLYDLGRTKKNPDGASPRKPMGNIVTNAKGGQSYHNYGLAIDFALLYDKDKNGTYDSLSWDMVADMDRDGQKDWMEVVKVFEEAGFEWGGRWKSIKDNPHFQMTFGYKWSTLLDKYNKEVFIPGTKYVKI